ncbi:MAG: hypothetical protein AB7U20_15095 [Planctomycetaceae bacterium]
MPPPPEAKIAQFRTVIGTPPAFSIPAAIDRIRDRAVATGDQELLKKADRMAAELRTR